MSEAVDRRFRLAPAEGWLTLGLVMLMCAAMAWSFDDAMLVLGQDSYTDFLTWTAIGGVLAGFLGAKAGWSRLMTYLIGAMFAALVTPLLVGWVLIPEGGTFAELYRATAESVTGAWRDLIVLDRLSTTEYGHHLLVLGLLVWGSSMFASFAAFGHRRPANGVILIGLLLVGNMGFTLREQLGYLVVFSLAALFLLIRFHAFDERTEWLRRRIGDPGAISSLYLRGGTVFIGVAVVGSLLLTSVAASDPLAGMWTNVSARLVEWSRGIERFLPATRTGVTFGPSFGSSTSIGGVWTTSNDPWMTVQVPADLDEVPYWSAVVYDQFTLGGWSQLQPTTTVDRDRGEGLLDGTGDAVDPASRSEVTVTIAPDLPTSTIFAPAAPLSVDVPVSVVLIGDAGYLAGIRRDISDQPYSVTSGVRTVGDDEDGGLTKNRLRAAGQTYPPEIADMYTALPVGALGPEATKLLDEIRTAAPDNPYDIAETIETTLRDDSRFEYDPDVRDLLGQCDDASVVECFATIKRGYCEFYASTMVVLLRQLNIPARIVEGFLPGKEIAAGTRQVLNSDSHAWVEVYFPAYGWVAFDPTGGGVAQIPPLPEGEVVPTASPGAVATAGPRATRPQEPIDDGVTATGSGTTSNGSQGPLIAVAALLAVIVGALAFVAWQRGPRGPVTADSAYGSVTRLAARLGFGPRPNQTVYEYAGSLAEVLPAARPELETVAHAKVEVAYGGRVLGADRLRTLRDAQRRLRVSLLRLLFRRDHRP
jgi:transglutaminase-like putative cysteine protease